MPDIPPGTQVKDLSTWAGRITAAWDALNGRPFGPLPPLEPTPPAAPDTAVTAPRQFQYPTGVNTIITPRREYTTTTPLTPFEQLRNLAALYDVAAICIASLVEEFQRKKWAVVARDKRRQRKVQPRCDAMTAFWRSPDRLNDYASWLAMVLYDVLTIDALSLYKRPNRGGGVYALEVVDGATIKPLLDERGRTVAYQQIIWGRPESQYRRPEADEGDEIMPIYAPTELIYKPRWTRPFTPYGFPPTEWIIIRINQALRKQSFDLAYFTDGNIPDMLATAPEGLMTPQQLQEFEEYFNTILEGSDQARRKMRFMPWKADVKELRPFSYETQLDYFMMQLTCAAYGRMPQALGFVETVNRAQGVVQNDITELREESLANWLKSAIFDPVIQHDLAEPELEWRWIPDRIIEDELTEAQIHQLDIAAGVISAGESRAIRYADELDGPAPGIPAAPPTHGAAPGRATPPATTRLNSPNASQIEAMAKREDPRDAWERKADKLMRQVYQAQLDRLQGVVESADAASAGAASANTAALEAELATLWQQEPTAVKKAVLPFFDELAHFAAFTAVEQLAFAGADWTLVNQTVLKLAQERALAFAQQLSQASEILTAEIVSDWISTGGTMPELVERVSRVWQGRRPDVAAVDAVTELFAKGQRRAWHATGVVKGYEINTARDSRVCPICAPKEGEYHDIDDEAGLPGFHNSCRCDIRPVVKEPEEV